MPSSFTGAAGGGSWADDMDFPSAPAARADTGPKKGEPGYLDSMPDRAARTSTNFPGAPSQREELPLPTVPPFTAFVGNLSYEPDLEDAVRDFFTDLNPLSYRILKDQDGKYKGFGYVEFPSQDTLKEALGRTGAQLQGRTIRVSVADAPTNRREPTAAEESSQWRRATPLAAREAPIPARRTSSFAPSEPGPDRDWGAARGARFTPAPPAPANDFRRDSSGAGRLREPPTPTAADEVDQWRSNKPLAEAKAGPRDLPPHTRGGPASGQSSPGLADTENTWSRGTKVRTPAAEVPPARSPVQPATEERDWRSARGTPATSQPGSADGESPKQPPAPLERRRLQLAPRSVPATPSTASIESESPSSKSSIFGNAKPVDSAAREAIADAKLAQKEEERKKAREVEIAKKKEEDEKAKAFAEERLNSIKAAQQKAEAQVSGKPQPPQQQRQNSGQGGQRHPPKQQQHAQSKPAHPSRKASTEAPKKDDDGFESVSHTRKGSQNSQQQQSNASTVPKRDATTRPAFSFAAAARAEGGFVEGDEDIEEAAKGVEEVKI
uniref:RRM domain-containing protein n=1 Tax=Kwoniella pini CBS 10737 TaxID=1296096 RepID=A0A1B9ICR1_9TREE|nr:uncharacterized protein I206_00618 [Kwoniella pini CBS 10737]OCF53316.1 hypothetical protein I206_00618 [Kwoniella pini CBS 10737]